MSESWLSAAGLCSSPQPFPELGSSLLAGAAAAAITAAVTEEATEDMEEQDKAGAAAVQVAVARDKGAAAVEVVDPLRPEDPPANTRLAAAQAYTRSTGSARVLAPSRSAACAPPT